MCMNTSRNVLEIHKCLRIIERDMFFNQLCILGSRKVKIRKFKNAVSKTKDVTELGKRFISSSSSTLI